MNRKLIFFDIDGTLTLPGHSAPTKAVMDAIKAAKANGHMVFLCTGRNLGMSESLLSLGFDGAVCSAGGFVFVGEHILYDHPMENELLSWAMDIIKASGSEYCYEAKNAAYITPNCFQLILDSQSSASEVARWRELAHRELKMRDFSSYNNEPVYKIMFLSKKHDLLEPALKKLEERFFICIQDGFSTATITHCEIINNAFDKGTGVRQIAEYLGVPIEDTIGFGDSMNDIGMINAVGTSYCMANGSEQVKALSTHVCPSVYDDGIAVTLQNLGLCD